MKWMSLCSLVVGLALGCSHSLLLEPMASTPEADANHVSDDGGQ